MSIYKLLINSLFGSLIYVATLLILQVLLLRSKPSLPILITFFVLTGLIYFFILCSLLRILKLQNNNNQLLMVFHLVLFVILELFMVRMYSSLKSEALSTDLIAYSFLSINDVIPIIISVFFYIYIKLKNDNFQ